jgi:hypothetical protein
VEEKHFQYVEVKEFKFRKVGAADPEPIPEAKP